MFFDTFLPKLLNMSLTAGVGIVLVLLFRLLLKKAPKVISYALWGVVLFRLLCPVSIESGVSLFGLLDAPARKSGAMTSRIEYVPGDIVHTANPAVTLPTPAAESVASPQGEAQTAATPRETWTAIAACVWMAGVLAMVIYAAVSYLRLRRKLVTASPLRDNLYLADEITSPFVMGLIRPKIYLPSSMEARELPYILLHEQHHIRRLDHIVKALAFAALCIHWFNPLVWVAFVLAGKDMEMSCDEAVIRKLGDGVLADYTASLLSLATGRRIIAGMPLAFGEGDPKGRIRNLANWKKPALWIVVAAVTACTVLAVCLLTNPKETFVLDRADIEKVTYYNQFVGDDAQGELNAAQIGEMIGRFSAVRKARRSSKYAGLTPGYQLCVFLKDGSFVYANGYNALRDQVEIVFRGRHYAVTDDAFAAYLRSVCSAEDVSPAQEAAQEPEIVNDAGSVPPPEIGLSDEISSGLPPAVIDYARAYTKTQLDYYTADLGYAITEAKITGITQENAASDRGPHLYLLEYRFRAAEPDQVMLAGGMKMDGDCITEWGSTGQPCLLLFCDAAGNWTRICVTNSLTIQEEYGTQKMLQRYGDPYTAAAMELFGRQEDGSANPDALRSCMAQFDAGVLEGLTFESTGAEMGLYRFWHGALGADSLENAPETPQQDWEEWSNYVKRLYSLNGYDEAVFREDMICSRLYVQMLMEQEADAQLLETIVGAEIALTGGNSFTFSDQTELSSQELYMLFLQFSGYDTLSRDCLDAQSGKFSFTRDYISALLSQYFQDFSLDITQINGYDPEKDAVVTMQASGFGGDRFVKIVEKKTDGILVTLTLDFYDNYERTGEPYQRKTYQLELYDGGYYFLSAVVG